ncbi:hypothetical protein [Cohnella thermotolerans]|uniref:hypothetical protein n=1 Tax=Cohnella thermotolerans TaxID=329858 RepID=UPI0004062A83|nr:hypothetical protein [Cohnella thermotolerans]
MKKFNKDLSFEERAKIIQAEVAEEKEFLKNLSFDSTAMIEVVKKFIDKWDPAQLLEMESPEDEYEAEIRTISIYIIKHLDVLNVKKLEQQIREVFEDAFEVGFAQDKSSIETATGIYTALRGLDIV